MSNHFYKMKIIKPTLQVSGFLLFLFLMSCHKSNEFGVADTFTVDSILVTPSANIDRSFEIGWAVTTTGYPAFFVKLYLSDDNQLDTLSDLKITETGSADVNSELNKPEDTQFYYLASVAGSSGQVTVNHNEKSSNLSATGWQVSKPIPDPAGKTKYIIGYFYNTPGLQIQYGRRVLAVPVSFK